MIDKFVPEAIKKEFGVELKSEKPKDHKIGQKALDLLKKFGLKPRPEDNGQTDGTVDQS